MINKNLSILLSHVLVGTIIMHNWRMICCKKKITRNILKSFLDKWSKSLSFKNLLFNCRTAFRRGKNKKIKLKHLIKMIQDKNFQKRKKIFTKTSYNSKTKTYKNMKISPEFSSFCIKLNPK
jgi:hypothetical protein